MSATIAAAIRMRLMVERFMGLKSVGVDEANGSNDQI